MPRVILLLPILRKFWVYGIVWILLHLNGWGVYLVVYILGRNFWILRFLHIFLISMMHLIVCSGSCRMHNIEFLPLGVFLLNQVVDGDYLLFAHSLWIVHSPMLIVSWGWWYQRILHSRVYWRLFYVRGLFLRCLRSWSHIFLLVLVPPRQNSSVLRDMVHVVGVLISHVGIFQLFFVM